MIAIIDGDSIPYLCSKDALDVSKNNVIDIMNAIFKNTGCTKYVLFVSLSNDYFRNILYPEYKIKRKPTTLLYVIELKQFLIDEYKAISYPLLESDDLCGISYDILKDEDYCICSTDKDVLNQIPGRNYNFKTHELGFTSIEDSKLFLLKQTLMGDSTDNIPGIPGVGEKTAEKYLTEVKSFEEGIEKVKEIYDEKLKEKGKELYLLNYVLVNILKSPDDLNTFDNEFKYNHIKEVIVTNIHSNIIHATLNKQ